MKLAQGRSYMVEFTKVKSNASSSIPYSLLLGTLRAEDGDGSKNVAEKVNSCSFNLHRDYSKSLTLSDVGEPS